MGLIPHENLLERLPDRPALGVDILFCEYACRSGPDHGSQMRLASDRRENLPRIAK